MIPIAATVPCSLSFYWACSTECVRHDSFWKANIAHSSYTRPEVPVTTAYKRWNCQVIQYKRSHLTRPATVERRDHQNNKHRRKTWRQFVETLDHMTDPSKLWRTIKAIDGKSLPKAENKAITFDDSQVSSPKQIANYFNRQFTTSKLGRHTSSCERPG